MNHTCMLPNQTSNKAKPHPINPNHILSTQLLSTHINNHRITRTNSMQLLEATVSWLFPMHALRRRHLLHGHRFDSQCQSWSFDRAVLILIARAEFTITSLRESPCLCFERDDTEIHGIDGNESVWKWVWPWSQGISFWKVGVHWSLLSSSWDFHGKLQQILQGE